jgi:hypothetical protein
MRRRISEDGILHAIATDPSIPMVSIHRALKILRDLSPRANYTDRATAACRRS